jgi:purine-binding chemotaxis protein CheW
MERHDELQGGEVLMIGLEDEIFAFQAVFVREILDPVPITEVPGARAFVKGLINVRGKVVPLADLRLRFGMNATAQTIDTRIVVLEMLYQGEPTVVGILADKVYEVTEMDSASFEEPPRVGMRWRSEFVRAIGKRNEDFIIVPNMEKIFN